MDKQYPTKWNKEELKKRKIKRKLTKDRKLKIKNERL